MEIATSKRAIRKGSRDKRKMLIKTTYPRDTLTDFINLAKNQMYHALRGIHPSLSPKLSEFELVTMFSQLRVKDKALHSRYVGLIRNVARTVFGVWQPIMVLSSANNSYGGEPVVTDGSGVLVNSLLLSVSLLSSISLLWALFDEYRFTGPFKVTYTPDNTDIGKLYGVGVIDFTNGATLTSVEEALSYDTAKIFDVTPHRTSESGFTEWNFHVTGSPDTDWYTTGDGPSANKWKSYSFNLGSTSWLTSTTYGHLSFEAELEFRQLDQGG